MGSNLFQASKISVCTIFQSRPSSNQGNAVRLVGVKSNQKVSSGKPSKFPVRSYYLGNITLMPQSYYLFPLGLLFFSLVDILFIAHSPSLIEPNVYQVHFELNPLLQGCNVKAISLSASVLVFNIYLFPPIFSKVTYSHFQGLGWEMRHLPVLILGLSMQFWGQKAQRST